ncbi:serine--tRNA ligase [candidate division WOR-3 bacterium]|nr:serine--tRNA ligase [candidate division WOR-3 bacterium]
MLDVKYIRENREYVKIAVASKGEKCDLDAFFEIDEARKFSLKMIENKRSRLNALSKEISAKKINGQDLLAESKKLSSEIKSDEKEFAETDKKWKEALYWIPNVPDQDVPTGKSAEDNETVYSWGKPGSEKKGLDHFELSSKLKLLDFASAGKVSKSAFPLYTGNGARLELALIMFMMEMHSENGYRELLPPYLVNRNAMFGTGQLPKLEEDMYLIEKDDLFLNPTAEVPVTNLFSQELLGCESLPVKICAYTTCFRREAGSYGKETKGLMRMHQFNKVELVHLSKPEESRNSLEELLEESQLVLKKLEIPFRTRKLCTGEMSFASAITYDLEAWAPVSKKYLEVSSVSLFRDFQSRRINIRFKNEEGKISFVHTLNGSALATPRTMIAILENYQQENGEVSVPEVLKKYFPGRETLSL